ncbi:hypothetical protein BDV95DRAFT_68151 [Massariosphaeria phaeospora]|uniref:Uncharacterized protein n=1 Tax=Massariosphaeria phaeospora TaxID=100035 RepID=A0A7C8M7G5_9PLEO|nr:hypothetical protein BDV95DRAFT_68151 [Massariosphaeria phaeospora]
MYDAEPVAQNCKSKCGLTGERKGVWVDGERAERRKNGKKPSRLKAKQADTQPAPSSPHTYKYSHPLILHSSNLQLPISIKQPAPPVISAKFGPTCARPHHANPQSQVQFQISNSNISPNQTDSFVSHVSLFRRRITISSLTSHCHCIESECERERVSALLR